MVGGPVVRRAISQLERSRLCHRTEGGLKRLLQ
jgi:hypothetical protein